MKDLKHSNTCHYVMIYIIYSLLINIFSTKRIKRHGFSGPLVSQLFCPSHFGGDLVVRLVCQLVCPSNFSGGRGVLRGTGSTVYDEARFVLNPELHLYSVAPWTSSSSLIAAFYSVWVSLS